MSMSALLSGVKTRLTAAISPPVTVIINVQSDEEPEPYAGQVWYAIYPDSQTASPDEVMYGLDELYSIIVGINMRLPIAPRDRQDEEIYLKTLTGLEVRQRAVVAALHQHFDPITSANTTLTAAGVPASALFIEPLRWVATENPVVHTAEYGHSDDPRTMSLASWLEGKIRFAGARRIQPVGSTT